MGESMGYLHRLAIQPIANIAATTTFSASSFGIGVMSNNLQETIELSQDDMLRGTRTRNVERVAQGLIHVAGPIDFEPNQVELETLMPYILGTASSFGSYVVADSLPYLYMIGKFVAKDVIFTTKVDKATFTVDLQTRRIRCRLDVIGTAIGPGQNGALSAAGTYDGLSIPAIDVASRPYMFYDDTSGITVNSLTYGVEDVVITIDNRIVPTFMSGQTATDVEPTDRIVTVSVRTKYTSGETALQTDTRAGTPRTGSIAFTNGAATFSFMFGNLMSAARSVVAPDRNHLRLPLTYQAYGVSTTKELVVALPA